MKDTVVNFCPIELKFQMKIGFYGHHSLIKRTALQLLFELNFNETRNNAPCTVFNCRPNSQSSTDLTEKFELKLKQQGWKFLYLMSVFASLGSILAAITSTERPNKKKNQQPKTKQNKEQRNQKSIPVVSWMDVIRLPGTSVKAHSMIANLQMKLKSRNREIMGRFLRQEKQL